MSKRKKGEGTLRYREKDRLWEGRIIVGKDEFGKPIRKTAYGHTTEEVFEKLARLKEEHEWNPTAAGVGISPGLTLDRFVNEFWYPEVSRQITARTLDRYVLDYGYVQKPLGSLPLGKIHAGTVLRHGASGAGLFSRPASSQNSTAPRPLHDR